MSGVSGLAKFCTARLRDVFEAEGSAVILVDRERNDLYFPIVVQADRMAGLRIRRTRFPLDQGIAGWVIRNQQATIVHDAANDDRHYAGVDQISKVPTRTMLAAPLRAAGGVIGVVEVVNPADRFLTPSDLEFLDHLAADIGLACERARVFDQLERELNGLRSALRRGGIAAFGVGAILLAGTVGLPLSGLVQLGTVASVVVLTTGAVLFATGRGWFVRPFKGDGDGAR